MRQVLVVLLIVGAAFAGGALVNGPGLQWAQARLLDYMGLKDGGEIPSVDSPAGPNPGPQAPTPAASPTPTTAPTPAAPSGKPAPASRPEPAGAPTPTPPPAAAPPGAVPEPAAPAPPDRRPPSDGGTGTPVKRISRSTTGEAAPPGHPAPGSGPVDEANGPPPAPLDPSIGPALLAAISSPSDSAPRQEPSGDAIPLELAPSSSMEAKPGAPAVKAPAPSSSEKSGHDAMRVGAANSSKMPEGWAALRKKLQDLGVSKYTIEGSPTGRVTFSCLIPLAGKQAVSQRFEAEGDDEFQAAQATVRRITLWRASHQGAGTP